MQGVSREIARIFAGFVYGVRHGGIAQHKSDVVSGHGQNMGKRRAPAAASGHGDVKGICCHEKLLYLRQYGLKV